MDISITHKQGRLLKEQLQKLCSKSSELKILIGFFYFSGIKAFYNALFSNPQLKLRVLVGTDIKMIMDRTVECILTEKNDFGEDYSYSDNEIRQRYLESLREAVNAPEFDKESFHMRIGYFIEMLRADRLVIRKTRGENRENLFIFDQTESDGLMKHYSWITGSSNLTRPGLTTESDVDIRVDDCGCEDVNRIFEELWDDAVKLTEDPATKQSILNILDNQSMVSPVTPYEAYVLALKTYLDMQNQVNASERVTAILEKNGYKKYRYQLDAVNQALTVLKEYNGVILADVVGLGKTVIACLIARGLHRRGIIIAPPGLIGEEGKAAGGWRDYKTQFKLDGWEIFSCGMLDAALDYVNADGEVDVVIVDEAHRFKNQDTQDYETLSNICRGKQVILLTATPFNNRPADIFSLLKLFIVPNRSKITLDNHLAARFDSYDRIFRLLSEIQKNHKNPEKIEKTTSTYRQLTKLITGEKANDSVKIDLHQVKEWSQELSHEIRYILEPVIIRRNRIDLRSDPDYQEEVTELSDMMPPMEQFFHLTREQSDFYDKVLNEYFVDGGNFKGAIYRPFAYEQDLRSVTSPDGHRELMLQTNLYDFMRRLLVHRFESSFGAFAQSLKNFLSIHKKAQEFIERTGKFILDRKLLEKIYSSDDDTIRQTLDDYETMLSTTVLPKNNKVYLVEKFARKDEFLADIRSDIKLFSDLIEEVKELGLESNDPKAGCLANTLFSVINGHNEKVPKVNGEPVRKVIVFSEYQDTVRHLEQYLNSRIPGKILTVQGTVSANLTHRIEANFDASFKGKQEDQFQVLLATDKMSEGHNLNRAGLVINYDIPWNPTRVIQRVGRINRIGKKVFQKLYIFNFFPTEQGATVSKSREIAATKMFMIHNTIGEDAQIFDIDETPSAASLYKKLQQNPEDFEQESFLTRVKKELLSVKKDHPEVLEKADHLPFRVKTAKAGDSNSLILIKRKGLGLFALKADEDRKQESQIQTESAIQALRCPFEEPRLELSSAFWDSYSRAGKFQQLFFQSASNVLSLEARSLNNVLSAITWCENNHQYEHLNFLRTILEDIRQYGSLPDYTLRKIAMHNLTEKPEKISQFFEIVQTLRNTLGDGYLKKLKDNLHYHRSQIIIAEEIQHNTENGKA